MNLGNLVYMSGFLFLKKKLGMEDPKHRILKFMKQQKLLMLMLLFRNFLMDIRQSLENAGSRYIITKLFNFHTLHTFQQ